MTNQEIIEMWMECELVYIHKTYEQDYIIDIPARRESFNNFTDMLYEDGQITEKQYDNLCLPDEFETEYHPVEFYI